MGEEYWRHKLPDQQMSSVPPRPTPVAPPAPRPSLRREPKFAFKLGRWSFEIYRAPKP